MQLCGDDEHEIWSTYNGFYVIPIRIKAIDSLCTFVGKDMVDDNFIREAQD